MGMAGGSNNKRGARQTAGVFETPAVWLEGRAHRAVSDLPRACRSMGCIPRRIPAGSNPRTCRSGCAPTLKRATRKRRAGQSGWDCQYSETDDLFFIESGQVTSQIEHPGQKPIRLETMRGDARWAS